MIFHFFILESFFNFVAIRKEPNLNIGSFLINCFFKKGFLKKIVKEELYGTQGARLM